MLYGHSFEILNFTTDFVSFKQSLMGQGSMRWGLEASAHARFCLPLPPQHLVSDAGCAICPPPPPPPGDFRWTVPQQGPGAGGHVPAC